MEEIQCIFCNNGSNQIVIRENGYTGRKCTQCSLIFISPRPAYSEVLARYENDQAHISAESHISAASSKRRLARHKIAIIKRYIKSGPLLEIGPGAGYFLDEAARAGFEVHGIETNKIQADFIVNNFGISCERTPLSESSFGDMRFNIVYHEDIISHLYDPIADFEVINRKLADNGILVFETGNFGDVRQRYYKLIKKFQYPDHLFLFGEGNLRELLMMTGFECVRIYRYSIVPQLMAVRNAEKATWFIKDRGGKTAGTLERGRPAEIQSVNINEHRVKQLPKNAFRYLSYLLRYKVGYVMPNKGRPQTVIVVARKRK